jgi:hypothetical protein
MRGSVPHTLQADQSKWQVEEHVTWPWTKPMPWQVCDVFVSHSSDRIVG